MDLGPGPRRIRASKPLCHKVLPLQILTAISPPALAFLSILTAPILCMRAMSSPCHPVLPPWSPGPPPPEPKHPLESLMSEGQVCDEKEAQDYVRALAKVRW